jgi:hypothetical protein
MGTSLTGLKIKDTYKSLIKVTDNSEATTSGKQLSDGNGNDFGLYVDTDGVIGVGAQAEYSIDASSKNDAIRLPSGTTGQRPTGQSGIVRYNTTESKLEYYDSGFKLIASESYVSTQISNLIDSAPATLDTLNEIAAALNDDANFNTTITNLIAAKQDTITGGATTIVSSDLTASKALVSNSSGKVAVSSVTDTELGYVSGVTSAIQTQIDGLTDNNTTYSISCVDGDNSDEEKIRLTAGGSGSGTDDIVLEAGTGLSIARSSDKITFTNTQSGGGAFNIVTENFSGDGSDTTFDVSNTIASENNLQIYIDGVYQFKNTYSTSGQTVTFSTAPSSGSSNIEITHFVSLSGSPNIEVENESGNGSTTAFTLTSEPATKNNLQIYIDGVYQSKLNYSVSGTTLTFTTAPPSGTNNIEITHVKLS